MSRYKSIILIISVLLLMFGSIMGISGRTTISYAATTIKIMPVGDSCTAGMGDPNMGSYRTELYKYYTNDGLSIDFVGSQQGGPSTLPDRDNEGHSGWMIPQIASNIDRWLTTYNPDVVLLWIGGNDAIMGGNINTTGLSNLIDQIIKDKPNVKLFVSDYYPWPDQIKQYNAVIPGVVREKANAGKPVYFVKLSDIDFVRGNDLSSDNLHLNPTGYSKIAKIWYKSTISILKSTATPSPSISPRPTPSVSPRPTPSVSPTPSATVNSSCTVNYYTMNEWSGGATVGVTIKNNGSAAINGWTLVWDYTGNQKVTNIWNTTYTQNGTRVTVKNTADNKTILANGSVNFGLNITYSGSNAKPSSFYLNGQACEVINTR